MTKTSKLFLQLLALLVLMCPLPIKAETLGELIEKCEYYLNHSTSEQKEQFSAYVEQVKSTGTDNETTVAELTKELQNYLLAAEPTDGIAFDVSFLMENPELTTSNEGWSMIPTTNYGESEIYNRAFDFNQTLSNVRPGLYRFNVTGFHRNSLYYSGIETQPNAGCVIYAGEMQLPLLTLYYDNTADRFANNTGNYANNMADAQDIFSKGYYADNSMLFVQESKGRLTLGLRNENTGNGNWTCFRNFKLEYLGAYTGDKLVGAYRIASANHLNGGAIVPGSRVNQNTPIYHATNIADGRSAYWYMYEVEKRRYALRNVATLQYITYDGRRSDGETIRRYMCLTNEVQGDSSLWTIDIPSGENAVVRSVLKPNHLFDLRTASNVIGSYDNANTANGNQVFKFYNAANKVATQFSNSLITKHIRGLSIGGRELVFDKLESAYYSVITGSVMEAGTYTATVDFTMSNGYTTLSIDGTEIAAGSETTIDNINAGEAKKIVISSADGDTAEAALYFTAMPMVQIYGTFGDNYTQAQIRVIDPDGEPGTDSLIAAKIRWRGATTRYRNKKQYAVKLYDAAGASMDAEFLGLRNDNNWILDGMVIDKARMRNRVVTDLWNDYATKPYYFEEDDRTMTGTRGRFVEMTLNDQYAGIYCLTDKIDRKQVRVKKTDKDGTIRGLLYKADDWSYSVFMGHYSNQNTYPMVSPPSYNNNHYTWDAYEQKHPDVEDGEPGDWSVLWNAVNFVATASDTKFTTEVGDYFDLPVVIDYYILMETILSTDNHGKNMYWAVYNKEVDKKMTIALWDLDATSGRRWDASEVNWNQNYTTYITYQEHGDFNLFRRLKACNVDNFNLNVRKRYKELRKTELNTTNLLNRFYAYKNTFDFSGAAAREEKRWTNMDVGEINLTDEMDYLTNWFTNRMNLLDKQFDIASLPDVDTGISHTTASASALEVYIEAGEIVVEASNEQAVTLYSIDGKLVDKRIVMPGKTRLGHYPAGIYLINKQKVVVR